MIRRTLALAGAAVLVAGIGGLPGPASADSGAGIAADAEIRVNEVGPDMDTGGLPDVEGDGIELLETTGTGAFDLAPYELVGCDPTGNFTIRNFVSGHTVPSGGTFVIGDNTYDAGGGAPRNVGFASGDLVQEAGGVAVQLDGGGAVLDSVMWDSMDVPPASPCDTYTPANADPTNTHTLQFDGTVWCASSPPTLQLANNSC